ncbi:MAG: PocR ligand-binding domain-containing protein [Kiritimatiellae bacterium]|jgi:signal transduction histidine kinase/ActR/RegA family two-component response regulator|nr:PocR ligand-binding domain-containing protein [Kiritimatiellia bacterium]
MKLEYITDNKVLKSNTNDEIRCKLGKDIAFTDLFDLDDIQQLQDQFSAATGVASIITTVDGVPITKPSNFCRLCNDIIRKTEKGCVNCYKSDSKIGQLNLDGPTIQRCMSGGLYDAGAGISVGGRHLANWLIGQVRDESQTEEGMRKYAREIGADEEEVVEAFHEVTAMSFEKFEKIAQMLFTLVNQHSNAAYEGVLKARIITENKRVEKELLKMHNLKSIGVLAGGIAHDFNNILTGLFGNIELAKMDLPQNHDVRKYLDSSLEALERAKHLTKQLLTFSKGGSPLLEVVDIRDVVQEAVQFNLSGSNVKANLDIPADLWPVVADKEQMSHVIANMIINARESMLDGGTIFIAAENIAEDKAEVPVKLQGDLVRFRFRDEGIGMAEDLMQKIFDPYFSTKESGSGLGLAIVHSIITRHNGCIKVDSTPNVGTEFTIYIPADKSFVQREKNKGLKDNEKITFRLGHILVMDDEKMVCDISGAMLKAIGYTVEFAENGEEALEKYKAAQRNGHSFDAVIMDLTIPGGKGGKETIVDMLVLDPDVRAIVFSGYSMDPIVANYKKYGFKGRLVKPFKKMDLQKELSRIMSL